MESNIEHPEVLDWSMAGDPGIRRQVLGDLLDANPTAPFGYERPSMSGDSSE